MKYIPNAIKFDTQSMSSSLIVNMIFEIANLAPKSKTCADLVSKLRHAPIFIEFGTKYKSEMLIVNMVLGIPDPNPKL